MAFIRLKNNQHKFISAEQGETIWRIMNGEIEGTPEQRAFCDKIAKVYLNRANAPASYLMQYPYNPYGRQQLVPAGQVRLPYAD